MDAVLGPWLETDILELQRMGVRFLPNPAHLEINGVKVSLTSADALSPMLRELVVQGDKVQEALRLLLHQRCLFPMVPREPAQVCEARAQALDFPAAPHLCIFPSLCGSMSATSVDGTLFLNPGPLCEAAGPGTFAELWVAEGQGSLKERMRVDFKKIEKS
ncbi:unnamed protein product [Effrenium voratum]|nr:unnamed protein product [Effrenium voratum]